MVVMVVEAVGGEAMGVVVVIFDVFCSEVVFDIFGVEMLVEMGRDEIMN
jgi:hypothetical protein